MKILKNKLIGAVVAIAALCLFPTSSAFAATPTLGKKYQNGVGNLHAWINYGSGVGYWQTFINGAKIIGCTQAGRTQSILIM